MVIAVDLWILAIQQIYYFRYFENEIMKIKMSFNFYEQRVITLKNCCIVYLARLFYFWNIEHDSRKCLQVIAEKNVLVKMLQ